MPAPKTDSMRGLAVFISDMRNCKSREEEDRRVNKELANIRSKFRGDKTLDGYQKKKYVCKLLFIFLLGHDIDFGYNEAVNLLSSNKYTEKQMGYLFISVLLNENHSLMNLVVLNLKNDLNSKTSIFVNLALQCIANIGTREMAENFGKEMPKLLLSGEVIDSTKQNAALCLLRFIRIAPDLITYDEWPNRVIHLLNDPHLGVVTSAVSLIEALVQRNPEEYSSCFSFAVSRLCRLVTSASSDFQDYSYYFITAPWLCVKLLRLLQNFSIPQDTALCAKLNECLEAILKKVNDPPKSKKIQHPNAKNAILFEAINLIIYMDSDQKMLVRASNQLGLFLQNKETNLRYLALESLCLLATSEYSHDAVKKHQETVITALKAEKDVSVRQKAVDLLYAMCDRSNAQTIVSEMLTYLETADFSIREEMVLKVAILSEKYATDYSWYVDTILNLIRVAGDYVSEEVWHRVIQIVVNREELQAYVAKTVFESLQASACHENMIKVGGYILGEFGNLIAGDTASPPQKQFEILHGKYHLCSPLTRQLLLTTFIKFINLFPEMKGEIQETLRNDLNSRSSNVEIQQRSTEYLSLSNLNNVDTLAIVLEVMPPFPERESSILSKLKAKKPLTTQLTAAHNVASSPSKKAIMSNGDKDGDMVLTAASGLSSQPAATEDLVNFDAASEVNVVGVLSETNGMKNVLDLLMEPSPILNRKQYDEFLMKKNGILFENEFIQVGVKSEYRTWQGRLLLFYGNKSPTSLVNMTHEINSENCGSSLIVTSQAIPNILLPSSQVQQMIAVDCMSEFNAIPTIVIKFSDDSQQGLNTSQHEICLYLPVSLNKFLTPATMPKDSFTQRWSNLKQPDQESQKIIDARGSMDTEEIKSKLECFGLAILPDIDTNPINFVVAGIVHVSQMQFGILGRIEPNAEVRKYRVTLRSVKGVVGNEIIRILEMII